jgi:hypothetical protein
MARKWILDTETKGTGAHIEPLEKAPAKPEAPLNLARFKAPAPPVPEPEPKAAPRFRVVDVMGARVLADDVDSVEAAAALRTLRGPLDARIYMWDRDAGRWRLLTIGQTRALWDLAARAGADA